MSLPSVQQGRLSPSLCEDEGTDSDTRAAADSLIVPISMKATA